MENTKPLVPLEREAKTVYVRRIGDKDAALWCYDTTGAVETHDPADRCGDPLRIYGFVSDSWGERLFLFCIADSHFPITYLVFGDNFQAAYECFIDHQADYLEIGEDEADDYKLNTDDPTCGFTSDGKPVDTDNVQGFEVALVRADY